MEKTNEILNIYKEGKIFIYEIAFEITGENDYLLKEKMEEAINSFEEEKPLVIIDFINCFYINSKGIGILANFHNKLEQRGGKMVLVNLPEVIARIFNITRLDQVFVIKKNKEEAVEYLKSYLA